MDRALSERIYGITVPSGAMQLDSISAYAADPRTFAVSLVHRTKLA